MNTQPFLNGEVTYDGDFARLTYQRRLPHPPERVWAALTDPAQIKQWFMASSATIDGRVDGTVETVAGPGQFHSRGRILAWEPPRVYEYEWIVAPRAELPQGENSSIRWELMPADGGTLLTMMHRRLTRPASLGFAPGWHAFLDRLAAQLDGAPLPDWMERFVAVKDAYPA
jgi:uncharacterized protein YndB with AHSA1/START domain